MSRVVAQFIATYVRFKRKYQLKRPEDEPKFIKNFLKNLDKHISCYVQRYLQSIIPARATVCQESSGIFIDLTKVKWNDIRYTVNKNRDLGRLQAAFDEKLSGPDPSYIVGSPVTRNKRDLNNAATQVPPAKRAQN